VNVSPDVEQHPINSILLTKRHWQINVNRDEAHNSFRCIYV